MSSADEVDATGFQVLSPAPAPRAKPSAGRKLAAGKRKATGSAAAAKPRANKARAKPQERDRSPTQERERRPSGGMLSVFELCNNSEEEARAAENAAENAADGDADTNSERVDTPLPSAEEEDEEDEAARDEGWSDHNRWYCNICKDGGELLCCDRCPRAFHMSCLGMPEGAIPDSEWYCKMCAECLDRRRAKKESKEKARVLRETAKLERDAKKQRERQRREEEMARKSAEAIEHKAKRVLEMQDRILSRKKIKYKDKEEETLGRLAEDLAQTVRAAKERLEKLEKEDAALRKKEEALNKKRRGADELSLNDLSRAEKPTPTECAFGDVPAKFTGQMLAVWDSVYSFREVLKLSPISVDQFGAVLSHSQHCVMLTELHMSLLEILLEDREDEDYVSDDEAAMDEGERYRYEIQNAPLTVGVPTLSMLNALSWPSILHNLIAAIPRYTAHAPPIFLDAFKALGSTDYPLLRIPHKLALLQFLVARAVATEKIRLLLAKHLSESIQLTKSYNREVMQDKKVAMEDEKRLREKQRAELAGVVEQGKTSVKTWLKKGGDGDSAMSVDEDETKSDGGTGTASGSDTELDDLAENEEALTKNEEELESLQAQELISRHEYLSRKRKLDKQRERIRQKTEEKVRKQKLQEQMERRRAAAKKGITDGLASKDAELLRTAVEKGKECGLQERIIVSATHVLELLDAEAVREEDAAAKKHKLTAALREFFVRTEPLGRDRDQLRYWILHGDQQRLYVEKPGPPDSLKRRYEQMTGGSPKAISAMHQSLWYCYTSQAEINLLTDALDSRIAREAQLRTALAENMDLITQEMPMSKPGLLISDLLNDEALARKKRRATAASPAPADEFLSWKNEKHQRPHEAKLLELSGVDALREEMIRIESWLSKRLRDYGSDWFDRPADGRAHWLKAIETAETEKEMIPLLLMLENEVMALQAKTQEKAASAPSIGQNASATSVNGKESHAGDHDKSDEEEEDDDDELDVLADDGSILWPTKYCRSRWITEVKKASTVATLAGAVASFIHRLDLLGLTESADNEAGGANTRAKSEKEKRSRKERAAKKKEKRQESEDEDDDTTSVSAPLDRRGESMDEWEEDCYICGGGGEVLCCDGCPRVFHHTCVGLRRIPRGKTFCHVCDPSVKPTPPATKTRRKTSNASQRHTEHLHASATSSGREESVGSLSPSSTATAEGSTTAMQDDVAPAAPPARNPEDIWDQDCSVCSLGGELLCCDGCPRAFHVDCIGLKEIPETEWFCDECNLQTCAACKKNKIRLDSHVICGSEDGSRGCERVFHLKCVKLTAVPAEDWYCKACRSQK